MELHPHRSYADRLTLLSLVAERHPYPDGWADQRAGIVLQTKWQDRSGRAVAGADGLLDSWWPLANWTLTVWQLEALQTRGELAEVTLGERPLALPGDVAADILAYYDLVDEVRQAPPEGRPAAMDELQRRLWRFHVRAIERGLEAAVGRFAALPAAEQRFAESWGGCMVGLLAAVNFPTEFETVRGMQRLLPMRLLGDEDWSGGGDLAEPQRNTLSAMRSLFEAERESGRQLERRLAVAAATSAGARAAANLLFETLAFGGSRAAELLQARLQREAWVRANVAPGS